MGDIADWINDSMQEAYPDWLPVGDPYRRRTTMTRHYNPAMQCFDTDEEDPHVEPFCKFCGSSDVRWRQQGGKWVLFSLEPGKVHVCPIEDDFGVVE